MPTESISVETAIIFFQFAVTVMSGGNSADFHNYTDKLIENKNMVYIERKEYWGDKPKLHNLTKLELADNCSARIIIEETMRGISEEKWEILKSKEEIYIRYQLPYYQRLNHCLLSYKTRLVNVNFGSDNDYIIAVPTEDQEDWKKWESAIEQRKIKLIFYTPFDDAQVINNIKKHLPSLENNLTK